MSNVIYKLVMSIWTERIKTIAVKNEWFADSQHGFRSQRGCQTACIDAKA